MRIILFEQSLDAAKNTYDIHMQRDFPENERKPWDITVDLRERGIYEMLEARWEGELVGYAWVVCPEGSSALIDYLAILPEFRNRGIGGAILRELRQRYSMRGKSLLLESEFPEEAPDPAIAVRRLAFYARSGFLDSGVLIRLFGVKFCILASNSEPDAKEQMRVIYEAMFPGDLYRQAVVFLN
jgi:GNAT superfamily N-acetyltransferase